MTSVALNDDAAAAVALDWCRTYLVRDHPGVGRAGAVCPFVDSALRAGTLLVRVQRTGPRIDAAGLTALVHQLVRTFRTIRWRGRNPALHSLLLVLPDLDRDRARLLDEVQAAVKPELAEAGLMLGQFHQDCPEPAARNPDFPVSRSPVPMLVLRHMAVHDVLFLTEDARCFAAYAARFGARYRAATVADPHFVRRYEHAARRFAHPGGTP